MNLVALREVLVKRGNAVVSTSELSRFSGVNQRTTLQYAMRMVKKGLLLKVERGKYSVSSDPFDVAPQLVFPSYISFAAGLYLQGYLDQEVNAIDVVSSKKHSEVSFSGAVIRFSRVDPRMMFGFTKMKHGGFYLFVGDLEKIIIDILYMPRKTRMNNLSTVMKDADVKKLLGFAQRAGSEAINRRLGYALDFFGVSHDIKVGSATKYKLNPSITDKGIYNAKWKLYINDEL